MGGKARVVPQRVLKPDVHRLADHDAFVAWAMIALAASIGIAKPRPAALVDVAVAIA